jgi:hypothetical protein
MGSSATMFISSFVKTRDFFFLHLLRMQTHKGLNGNDGNMDLRNVGILPQHNTTQHGVTQPRKPRLETSSP